MIIDDKLISYLEDLSCLTLSDGEKKSFAADLQETLSSMTQFNELNTSGVQECCSPLDNVNVFRDDKVLPSCARELILKNAPIKNDEMIIAPKTVD